MSTSNTDSSDAVQLQATFSLPNLIKYELGELKKSWWAILLAGFVFVIGGIGAIAYPLVSSVSITMTIGCIALTCGFVTIFTSFWAGRWGMFFLQLFYGVMYVVLGGMLVYTPIASEAAIALLIASFAISGGFFRAIAACTVQFPQWGWAVLGGTINVAFGLYIISLMPEVALWLLGTLVGVDLLITGISWMLLAFQVRKIPVESA